MTPSPKTKSPRPEAVAVVAKIEAVTQLDILLFRVAKLRRCVKPR